jgi:eukaryotic-like serine/threonine-protein kinase
VSHGSNAVGDGRDRTEAATSGVEEAGAPLGGGARLAPGYRIIAHLRRGSVVDVYDVWSDERHCHCVAKTLRPDHGASTTARRGLIREARLLSRLAHPHLVRAYELIERPSPILILETITGATLEYLIDHRQRRLDLSDVVLLGVHLCSAVHYLHRQGLLHLDLKPGNVVCERGLAKVLDLDIARPPGPGRREGTRCYMAPEQVRGDLLSEATDVWGIGTVLFEAATGRLPFDFDHGPRYPQLAQRAAPIRSFRRLPAAVARAVDGALEPAPDRRPTVDELHALLAPLFESATGGNGDVRPPRNNTSC